MTEITQREITKYTKTWSLPSYAEHSPGLDLIPRFQDLCKPPAGASVIDVGAGAGAAAIELCKLGYDVTAFDLIRPEGWNHRGIVFDSGCIWRDLGGWGQTFFDYAYCCDVLEHIPTQFVALSIESILEVAQESFFSISFTPDVMGNAVRERLHLTVEPFTWWCETFREVGCVLEARDLIGGGLFVVRH